MEQVLLELIIIIILCVFQSVFGVGLLLFGTPLFLMIGYDLFILGVSKSEKLKDYVVIPLPLFGKEWMHQLNNENTFWGSRNLYLFIRKDFKNIYNLVNDLKNF